MRARKREKKRKSIYIRIYVYIYVCVYIRHRYREGIDVAFLLGSSSFSLIRGSSVCLLMGISPGFNYLNVVILTYAKRSNFKRQLPVRVFLILYIFLSGLSRLLFCFVVLFLSDSFFSLSLFLPPLTLSFAHFFFFHPTQSSRLL